MARRRNYTYFLHVDSYETGGAPDRFEVLVTAPSAQAARDRFEEDAESFLVLRDVERTYARRPQVPIPYRPRRLRSGEPRTGP